MFEKILGVHIVLAFFFASTCSVTLAGELTEGNALLQTFMRTDFAVRGEINHGSSNGLIDEYTYTASGNSWSAVLDSGYESRDSVRECLAKSSTCEILGTGRFELNGDQLFVRIIVIERVVPARTDIKEAANIIAACWNVGSLSVSAIHETASVFFRISAPDFRPELLVSEPTLNSSQRQVYESGKRAVIRCGVNGLPLPLGDCEMRFSVPNYEIIPLSKK